jgi:hypothetical protein
MPARTEISQGQIRARWARAESEVLHFSRIGQECLRALTTAMRPYLSVTLRNKTIVHGWLEALAQQHNATEATPVPTEWRAAIMLRDNAAEIELDFLEIDEVRASLAPAGSSMISTADERPRVA